jgi:hypothetical protein
MQTSRNPSAISHFSQMYEQIDLNEASSFELYIPEKPMVNFNLLSDQEKASNSTIVGLLDDQMQVDLQHCSDLSFLKAIMHRFETVLDKDYSIAVNTRYLKVEDMENYSYAGLLNIETKALLKSAVVFNSCLDTITNNYYFGAKYYQHQSIQGLIDKIYRKILHISFHNDSNSQ